MGRKPQLLDHRGNPVQRTDLTRDVAAPTIGGVRSPVSGYPGDGLNPILLSGLLRAADHGNMVQYLELAEVIEERDPHYLGVISTRKRSVAQLDVTVEAASDDARDVAIADMVRDWIDRDDLGAELFNILDCLGKGVSFTEIDWETSAGQWRPRRLIRRDPRWFRFDRTDLETPLMLDDLGREVPLAPFKFIYGNIPAKSGLPIRSGLARTAAWGWMFKAFTLRDWAIFTQTYGQPLRLGKWQPGASEQDKATLFRAVSNIAGDCAAIIPASMSIEFVETGSVGASSDLYERRANWLDQQISKAVLGNTATTDAIAGGHAVGRVHRQVQEDIERADAAALSAILNRDLVRPWVDLEFGPQQRYPRLRVARADAEDVKSLSEVVARLVPLGLRVEESQMRDRLGFEEPGRDAVLLTAPAAQAPTAPADGDGPGGLNGQSAVFKRGPASGGMTPALQAAGASAANSGGVDPMTALAARLELEAEADVARMIGQIEAILAAAGSLEEAQEMILAAFPRVDATGFATRLGDAMLAAHLAGRAAVAEEADG